MTRRWWWHQAIGLALALAAGAAIGEFGHALHTPWWLVLPVNFLAGYTIGRATVRWQ